MLTKTRSRTYLCITLLLIFAVTYPTAAQQGDLPVPEPAPTWADAEFASANSVSEIKFVRYSAAAAGCRGQACLYLPAVARTTSAGLGRTRAEALGVYRSLYVPSQNVANGWNGSVNGCQAGATSNAFRNASQRRINYFRQMAGLGDVQTLNNAYNQKDQAAALMMSANNSLSHTPPAGWKCYSADGAQAAGSSNLFLGMYGPEAIDGYIRDPGSGNSAAGHRRWILLPQMTVMGVGDIPNGAQMAANALWVFDASINNPRPATRYPFVAWPPPGYVPHNTVFPRWSFALKDADFSRSTVTLTKGNTPIALTVYPAVNGFGENTLVWQVNGMGDWDTWAKPAADTTYTVTIHKVKIGGVEKNFTYPVTIFDPAK